jgi:mediator of RNA polymerase II transcription subunit 14
MTVTAVENGKAYVKGGGEFGWTAQLTVVGFGDARDPEESRWWLTGIDWGWRESSGVGDESKPLPKLSTEDRDQTLETVNREVLTPRSTQNTETNDENKDDGDAPLVRLYNFLGE